jgi:hypothetical protein
MSSPWGGRASAGLSFGKTEVYAAVSQATRGDRPWPGRTSHGRPKPEQFVKLLLIERSVNE